MRTLTFLILSGLVLFNCNCKDDDDMVQEPGDPCQSSIPIGEDYTIDVPSYITDPMFIPTDNPMKAKAVELGRFLFWEKRLSGDNSMSCGTCHIPTAAFSDPEAVSVGIDGIPGTRSTMALVNLVFEDIITWDGSQPDLETQSAEPVLNPIELHDTWDNVLSELADDAIYPSMFEDAFGSDCITRERAEKAMAQFIRSMVSFNSRYDKWKSFQGTLTVMELDGMALWSQEGGEGEEGGDCFHCHTIANHRFTDNDFHNNGLDSVFSDLGLGGVTGLPQDYGRFKTPNLRNIALSAPYMHDGRFQTLEEVVEHYNTGGVPSATIDFNMEAQNGGLFLSTYNKAALVAFMNTLTDEEFIENPDFQDPF